MTDLFGFLILATLFALVIGMAKPALFSRWIKEPTRKKVGLILGGLLFLLFIAFNAVTPSKTPATDNATAVNTQTEQKPVVEPETTSLTEEEIKKVVSDVLKGQNNNKKDKLKQVTVTKSESGGWAVDIEFNADDNLSTNLRKIGIEKQMSRLYTSLYKDNKNIKRVAINAYFPMQDQYGNVNDKIIYTTTLDSDEANKVNWDVDSSSLELSILPKVWETYYIHPEFK